MRIPQKGLLNMNRFFYSSMMAAGIGASLLMSGCATPAKSTSNDVPLDSNVLQGGISSRDIRTVATTMTPAILALPEIAQAEGMRRIKLSNVRNRSRFFFDCNLLMKRLTVELNRYGRGKVRFLNNNGNVQQSRAEVSADQDQARLQENLRKLAVEIAANPLFLGKKLAVIPVLNSNLVNMNAESFTALLRSEIVNASGGKIQFLMPGVLTGADYYLTGQFYPESMKTEGIINLANYIEVVDARVKDGKSMYIENFVAAGAGPFGGGMAATQTKESYLMEMLRNPELRKNPNANKNLNVMIVKPDTKVAVFEKMIRINRRISDNSGRADLILSAEISGLAQRKNGVSADYLLFSFQLTDPESNEVIWEDAYEIQRTSETGIEYR